jgi:hypothetical protein
MAGAVEVTIFELRPEIAADEMMRRAGAAAAVLKACGGFVQRLVSRDESGQWVDIVQWESMQALLNAEAACAAREEITAFAAAMEPGALVLRQETPEAAGAAH